MADAADDAGSPHLAPGRLSHALDAPEARAALLRAMDLNCWELYREVTRGSRGGEVLDTPDYALLHSPRGTPFHNAMLVRAPLDLATVQAATGDFHLRRGATPTVWLRAHADQPLEAALRAAGWATFTTMPGMALLGDPGTRCAPDGLRVRAVRDDAGRDAFRQVSAEAYAVYGAPPEYADDAFARLESLCAPHVQGFVGWHDGLPVAAAALYLSHGVAGIGWVGCVPAARGQRFAEAVTWAAIREGFRRGAGFANLQASPMGRPVYERMGFATPTEYRVLIGPG